MEYYVLFKKLWRNFFDGQLSEKMVEKYKETQIDKECVKNMQKSKFSVLINLHILLTFSTNE